MHVTRAKEIICCNKIPPLGLGSAFFVVLGIWKTENYISQIICEIYLQGKVIYSMFKGGKIL